MDQVRPVRSLKKPNRQALIKWRAVDVDPLDRSLELAAVCQLNHYAAALAFLLLVSQSVAPGAFAQDRESLEHPTTIRGTVINRITREPIGRALVYSPDNRFARLTDEEGHFEYPIPKAAAAEPGNFPGIQIQRQGDFTFCCVTARKPGFVADPNEEQGAEISLDGEPTIALTPEGHIKGRVLLPSSDAATGIRVQLFSRQVQDGVFRWIPGRTVQANSNGEFRFAELLPGEYKLVTHELMDTDPTTRLRAGQLYGFPPIYFPAAPDFAGAAPIVLKAGQTFEADFSPARQAYYPVRIPVPGDIANGMITVSIQGHDSPGYSLGYSADRHRIEGFLPNGVYQVSMESSEPNAASGTVSLAVAGAPAQGSPMVLAPHSSIRLNVTETFISKESNMSGSWSSGNGTFEVHGPRLNLQASVEPIDDLGGRGQRSVRPPRGKDDTSLVISDVPPGRYRLRLFASRGYVTSATAGGVDLLQEPLVVLPGTDASVDINMRDDFAEIEGTLTHTSAELKTATSPGSGGRWKPPAFIFLIPLNGEAGQYQQVGADNEGHFGIGNVAPGKYLVLAFEKQQMNLPYRDAETMRNYEAKGRTVRLNAAQKEKLELPIISSTE
jgi:hypothetical protein